LHVTSDGHYSEGMRIAEEIKALDGPNVNPLCHTRVYTHGRRVERSLVLLHGFTNCPQQMDELGRRFHERGWNVFVPRYPRPGYTDRLNTSIARRQAVQMMSLAYTASVGGIVRGERVHFWW